MNSAKMERFRKANNRGFTLIEITISIVLIGIVSGIVAVAVGAAFRTVKDVQVRKDAVLDGSSSMNHFVREFRHVENNKDLIKAEAKLIQFETNLGKKYQYELTGGKLYRKIGKANPQIMADFVVPASSTFRYFQKDNLELTSVPLNKNDRPNVYRIKFDLVLVNEDDTVRYSTNVFPENLR